MTGKEISFNCCGLGPQHILVLTPQLVLWGTGTTDAHRAPSPVPGRHLLLITGGHHLYHYCDCCCYALQHDWHPSILTFSGGTCPGGADGSLADSPKTSVSNQVLELVMFSCHRLYQRLSSPGPAGLLMQSTSRLLAYKTTTQKLFTQIIDAGQPWRNSSSKQSCTDFCNRCLDDLTLKYIPRTWTAWSFPAVPKQSSKREPKQEERIWRL